MALIAVRLTIGTAYRVVNVRTNTVVTPCCTRFRFPSVNFSAIVTADSDVVTAVSDVATAVSTVVSTVATGKMAVTVAMTATAVSTVESAFPFYTA